MGRGGVKSTMVQAFVSGAVQAVLYDLGIGVHLVPVGTWKKATVGKGNATKAEVKQWVEMKYPTLKGEGQDILDAAALADYGHQVLDRLV